MWILYEEFMGQNGQEMYQIRRYGGLAIYNTGCSIHIDMIRDLLNYYYYQQGKVPTVEDKNSYEKLPIFCFMT